MSTKSAAHKTGMSRRNFLQGLAAGTTLAALGSLAGCAPGNQETQSNSAGAAQAVANGLGGIEVIEAEFLVIGTGNAAQSIAAQAILEGKHVTLIDKAPYRHSGVSGMSWDAFGDLILPEDPANDLWFGAQTSQLIHGEAWKAANDFDPNPNKRVYEINHGQYLPHRNEDGSVADYAMPGWSDSQFFRHEMDNLLESSHATVYDRTMIIDLLVNEGVCIGAIGLHLPSGSFRVFHAPATCLATGGCTWIYGWNTVRAYSIGSPDNTGDVEMAAFRRGAGIGDAEFCQYDVLSNEPSGLSCAFGAGVCGDAQEAANIYGNDGELIFDPTDPMVADRQYFVQVLAKETIEKGRGSEVGGVVLNVGETPIRYANERNVDLLRKFDIDVRSQSIEAVPEMYEHGGAPVIDGKLMSVDFPGLFCVRGGGATGSNGGGQVHFNRVYGPYLAHNAIAYADSVKDAKGIDWEDVRATVERAKEMLTRTSDKPVRPFEIHRAIQAAGYKGLGIYRTAENMNAALEDVAAIRENIVNMVVTSDSPVCNREWKEALEAYNMLDDLEVSLKASLAREETRGMYLRADFPERDDENWNCLLVCTKKNDSIDVAKADIPQFNW